MKPDCQRTIRSRERRSLARPRGFFVADGVAGIAMVAVLATVVIVAVRGQRIASGQLADSRGATWAAEHAIAALQAGRPIAPDVHVEPVATENTPAGYAWVRVHAERNGRSAMLVGLVPKGAVPTTAPAAGGQR